jgi:tetratricopeptide (TPR) repeat protein
MPPQALTAAQERVALALFDAALDREPASRDAWLAEACVDNAELLAQVRALIAADEDDDEPLWRCAANNTLGSGGVGLGGPLPPAQIGPYRLDELIGSGGMGSVYRASRNDGLFEQTVAIKFVRPVRGLAQVEVLIDAERRLLARMRHPAIAHILDAGTTANGLHFLVMEFVDGVALDEHVRARHLETRACIGLLIEVCAAVAHAHQHLVLHCDIKPANILVTDEGRPKLIDFGVARLQDVFDAALPQGFTRAYTSPQRLAGEQAAVTDDVYSLGKVLVELLTGEPTDAQSLALSGQAIDTELAAVARKALSPAREDRYASVQAFEDDLRHWLACKPVVALGDDWRYRSRKLVQRHPWRMVAASVALGGLVIALVVISALYTRAETARRDAEKRFAEVRSLANYMLFDLDTRLEGTPGTTQARRELVGRSQEYLDTLGTTAGNDLELQREVAVGLARLAEVQGVPGKPHVGEVAAARSNLERAERLLIGLTEQRPQEWAWQRDLGRVRYLLALFYGARDNDPARQLAAARQAEQHLVPALDAARGAVSAPKVLADMEVLLTSARLTQADAHKSLNDHTAAAALQEREEARLLALPEALRAQMEFEYQSGRPAMLLGDSLYYLDRRDEALAAYRRATARFREGLLRTPVNRRLLEGTVVGHWNISSTLDEMGLHPDALAEIDLATPLVEQLVALDPGNVEGVRSRSLVNGHRAIVLANLGRLDEAIELTERDLVLKQERARRAPENAEAWRDLAVPQRNLAVFYRDKADVPGACRVLRRAIAAWEHVEQRWGLTELDRRNELEVVRGELAKRCR